MKIAIDHVNRDEGYRIGEYVQDIEDTIFEADSLGDMFRALRREYGRCTGRVYVDYLHKDSKYGPYAVGWVFLKRVPYDDEGTFLQETWVTLLDVDKTVRVREYHKIGGAL